ncbi:MAG: topoisomerase IV [Defluviitaleaceae bacterium]|nr:topoisomerase IV [Defluviitaleaceae bacterium]
MPYAMSVIVSRAIPEIDGFKPAHRKLLYTMYKMGLISGGRVKSADIVGQTMRLNPHGDGPIYETMVRLTRGNDALLHPFVDSKGNFGKQYSRDMAYAASRYTEARLDDICKEVFRDIDKNVVDMVDNYNATMLEPSLLPTTFPNLLVTPNHGIAVGMASTVCSFNLVEVCQTTIAWLKNPSHDITSTLLAPDFSTGGELIFNPEEIKTIYETGRGGFKLRGRWRFDKKNSCIEVYEIPYTTTIEAIIDKIAALVKSGKIRDINDVRDETDLKGLKITIDIKKTANPDQLMQRLFSLTTLQDSFSCNFNFLIDGRPKVMGIQEILQEWTAFRTSCIKRQLAYDIEKKSEKLHLLEGLAKILVDIDRAIKIIRETPAEREVIPNLMNGFAITNPQAEFIAEIKLRHLNREHLLNRIAEREALAEEINNLKNTFGSEQLIKRLIATQLKEIAKKYGSSRRTEIIAAEDSPALAEETFIDDYNLKLFLTGQNYVKKISLASLRSSGEQYLKDDDFVAQELEASNKDEILLFSNQSNVYKMKMYDLPDCKASALGEYLTNLLDMAPGERILYITTAHDYEGYMVFAFENGKASKICMSAYATKTNRKKLINAFSARSPVVDMHWIPADSDIYLQRGTDKAMVINSALIPANTSKSSGGVIIFILRQNTKLTTMRPACPEKDDIDYYRADKIPTAGHFLQKQMEL